MEMFQEKNLECIDPFVEHIVCPMVHWHPEGSKNYPPLKKIKLEIRMKIEILNEIAIEIKT